MKRLALLVICFVGLALFVVWLMLSSPFFANLRGGLAERVLSSKLGQVVQINDGVSVDIIPILHVSARGIAVPSETLTDVDLAQIGELQFDLAFEDLRQGRLNPRNLSADKARVNLVFDKNGGSSLPVVKTAAGDGDSPSKSAADPATKAALSDKGLTGFLAGKEIRFSDSNLIYQDARNGLDLDLSLASLGLAQEDQKTPIVLKAEGDLNGQKLSLTGTFPQTDPFAMRAKFDHMSVQIDGKPGPDGYQAGYSAALSANIAELGQLLDVLKLEKSISGTGNISATFESAKASRRINDLKVDVALDSGQSLELSGNLGELGNPDDVSIDTKIRLYAPNNMPPATRYRRDLKLTGIDMTLTAQPGGIPQRGMAILTNGFVLETSGEGPPPVSVSGIARTPEGLVKLGKAILRIGPPETPFIVFEGDIADALRLEGIDVNATIAVPATSLFGPEIFQGSDVLGHVSGGFHLSGNATKLGLSKLKAVSEGTDLWNLDVTGSVANALNFSDVNLDVSADVPSGAKFLSALRLKPVETGPIKLTQKLSSLGNDWKSVTAVSVNKSQLGIAANIDFTRGDPTLTGQIESDLISVDDLRNIIAAAVQMAKLDTAEKEKSQKDERDEKTPSQAKPLQPLVLNKPSPTDTAETESATKDTPKREKPLKPLVLKKSASSDADKVGQPDGDAGDTPRVNGPYRDVTLQPLSRTILTSGADMDVTIDLRKIEGAEATTSLHSKLEVKDEHARLGPVKFEYGGGHFDVTGLVDMRKDPDVLKLTGSTGGWDFGKIMHELKFKKSARGILNANFDLSGNHASVQRYLDTLSGGATVSMRNGSIDSQLLDLAGLGVVPWLFSKDKKKAVPIVCVRAPLSMSNGRISIDKAVLETDLVQIVVLGDVDLRNKTLNIAGQPRRIGKPLSRSPWPFTVVGPIAKPKIKVKDGPRRLRRSDGATTMPKRRKICVPDILQLK